VAIPPLGVRSLHEVDLVGAPPLSHLAEVAPEGQDPLELWNVLVADAHEAFDEDRRVVEAFHADHDVYDRLRRKPRHRRAAHVLDPLRPRADSTFDTRPLFLVERGPSVIVRDHDNGVSAHYAAESVRGVTLP
jgi:hypothetical protein